MDFLYRQKDRLWRRNATLEFEMLVIGKLDIVLGDCENDFFAFFHTTPF